MNTFYGIARKYLNAAWLGPYDQRHQICNLGFQSMKKTVLDIFVIKGFGSYLTETVLPKVVLGMKNQRPANGTQNVFIHHDSVRPHNTRAIIQYFGEQVQICPTRPAVQTSPYVTSGCSLSSRTEWLQGSCHTGRTSGKL